MKLWWMWSVWLQVSGAFIEPDYLESNVRFWVELFTQHPSNQEVLHDRNCPEAVWQVIDLPRKPGSLQVDEVAAARLTKQRKRDLQTRFAYLVAHTTPRDALDEAILQQASKCNQPAKILQTAASALRSQRGVAEQFAQGLTVFKKYYPIIRNQLLAQNLPLELAALPMIESMYNPRAKSGAGAAGLWQLMPATARGQGLSVQRHADQRLDVAPSTKAAAKVLRHYFDRFGNWPLAITAYNHGPTALLRAMRKYSADNLATLILRNEEDKFGFSSKNYYAEFLAVTKIMTAKKLFEKR